MLWEYREKALHIMKASGASLEIGMTKALSMVKGYSGRRLPKCDQFHTEYFIWYRLESNSISKGGSASPEFI